MANGGERVCNRHDRHMSLPNRQIWVDYVLPGWGLHQSLTGNAVRCGCAAACRRLLGEWVG